VLDGLRDGVQRAIEHLGQGFLAHPANTALKEKLRSGALDKQDYYRQILRLVYRLLFLFVADDRDLLLTPTADPAAQRRYRDFYATTRFERLRERVDDRPPTVALAAGSCCIPLRNVLNSSTCVALHGVGG
jgi:hypothetical protein